MQTIGNQSEIVKNDNDFLEAENENFEEDDDFDIFAESEKEHNSERNTVAQPEIQQLIGVPHPLSNNPL